MMEGVTAGMAPSSPQASSTLSLTWDLAELPSAQHRSGLAGLVLMVRWLEQVHQGSVPGVCKVNLPSTTSATLEVDRDGLKALFKEVYGSVTEMHHQDKPRMSQDKKTALPIHHTDVVTELNAKGKMVTKTRYFYQDLRPKGAFLTEWDPGGTDGLWVKLWRDMMWSSVRGKSTARKPFVDHAATPPMDNVDNVWDLLTKGDKSVDLSSTYYLGCESKTAEGVPFQDQARFMFLLYFWPFVAQVYAPRIMAWKKSAEGRELKEEFVGYALAIPDVGDLEAFCDQLPRIMRNRGVGVHRYRPREAVVDLAVEGGLDMLLRLRPQLRQHEGTKDTVDLVLGMDVIHVTKQKDSVRVLGVTRMEPEEDVVDTYAAVQTVYKDPIFRRQRLLNLVANLPWFHGFDSLLRVLPTEEQGFGSSQFCTDARVALTNEGISTVTNNTTPMGNFQTRIHRICNNYVSGRLAARGMVWEKVRGQPASEQEYNKAKGKVAKDAFLSVRSRFGSDFLEYFTGTLCSVAQQRMNPVEYMEFSQQLIEDTSTAKALTMLALSAV